MLYAFENYVLDTDQRELRFGQRAVALQPQVFDLLEYLIRHRDRVVTKDDLIAAVWGGRIVSESALTTRINAARTAIGDSGDEQRLIKTLPRKGIRFVGTVREAAKGLDAAVAPPPTEAVPAPPPPEPINLPLPTPPAERRQVTVVSCELLVGGGRIDPEDFRDSIGRHHRRVAEIAGRFAGSVGHSVGRTIPIYFGYPAAHEDDAEQAVNFALALCAEAGRIEPAATLQWRARLGIATGQVIIGQVNGGETQEPTPMGEAAETAAQLQAAADPGAVLVDSATRQLIGGLFDCREIAPIKKPGAAETLRAWLVLGTGAVDSRFEALRPVERTPLVGRGEEIELLMRRWTQAKSGEGRVVLMSGEPGIGKSRLAAELQTRLQAEPHGRLRYFCSPNYRDSALRPMVAQLERAAGIEAEDEPVTRFTKLKRLLDAASPTEAHLALLAELLSIPSSGGYQPVDHAPQVKRQRTFEALLHQLENLARVQPLLMTFEDVHWIDPTSHELLDRAVEIAARLPMLLLVTFRPEFTPPWTDQPHVTMVTLNRLSRREGAALLAGVAGDKSLSRTLVDEIVERTDGVPLFVEELTKAILEADGEGHGEEIVSRVPPRTLAVPATLHASLMARLDRLGPAKEIAQIGAAIGREFPYDLLFAVAQRDHEQLGVALEQLTESGLVSRRGVPPQATYTFKHALVQEAAYETLLRRARQQLQARIADALENSFPAIAETQPELLALHLSEALLPERAQAYWLRASQIAAARSANIEAVAHATRGLEELVALPAGPARDRLELELRSARGPALIASKGYAADETVEDYERARELMNLAGDNAHWNIVLTGLLVAYYNRGRYRQALDVGHEFVRQAEGSSDPVVLCVGHRLLSGPYNALGEFVASERHGEIAFGFYDPILHPRLAWRYVHDIGVAAASQWGIGAWHRGHIGVADSARDQAIGIARRLGHHNTTGYALYYNGVLASFLRQDFPALERYAAELLEHAAHHNLPQWTAWTSGLEGVARAHAGKVEEAATAIEQGIALCDQIKNHSMRTVFLAGLADVHLMAGRPRDAEQAIHTAFEIAERTEERWMNAELWRLRARLALAATGRAGVVEAEQFLRNGIAVAESQGSVVFSLRLTTELARLAEQRNDTAFARELLASALQPFTDGFDTPDLKAARALLDELAT